MYIYIYILVRFYVTWCRHVESLRGVTSQVYNDDLKCTSYDADSLLEAAQCTVNTFQAEGQAASPSKCVLLNTFKTCRRRVKAWMLLGR